MQVLRGKGQQQKEEKIVVAKKGCEEQQKIGNSKSASSQKGFGASHKGKPDGFLFTFREKLFIYAQKGIQASF